MNLEIGSGAMIGANGDYKGFEEQLIGHKPGDTFTITTQFPDEYENSPDKAGKVAEFDINWNEGISRVGCIIDVGSDLGLIEKRGSWFAFDGEQLAQGREAVKALLQENHELEEKILAKIKAVLAERKAAAQGTGKPDVIAQETVTAAAPAPAAEPEA